MRYYHQIENNRAYNKFIEDPPNGSGYSILPYFGYWNKYGPYPFSTPMLALRSALSYTPYKQGLSLGAVSAGNGVTTLDPLSGPVPDIFKISISGVTNLAVPAASGMCLTCDHLNGDHYVHYVGTAATTIGFAANKYGSLYSNIVFEPGFSTQACVFNYIDLFFYTDKIVPGLFGSAAGASGEASAIIRVGNVVDGFLFNTFGEVNAISGVIPQTDLRATVVNFPFGVELSQPSGIKFLELSGVPLNRGANRYIARNDNTQPYQYYPLCNFDNAKATISPVKNGFFDVKSTLRQWSSHLYDLPAISVVGYLNNYSCLPVNLLNNGIKNLYNNTNGLANQEFNINHPFPFAFEIQISGVQDLNPSGDYYCVLPSQFYFKKKKLRISSDSSTTFFRSFAVSGVDSQNTGIASGFPYGFLPFSELSKTVDSRVFPSGTQLSLEWFGSINDNQTHTLDRYNFYNICDLGCAYRNSDNEIVSGGGICNNVLKLDLVQYHNGSGIGPTRVDAFVQFGQRDTYTQSYPTKTYALHNFYLRKTICDDTGSNPCSEQYVDGNIVTTSLNSTGIDTTASSNIILRSGLIDCYDSHSYKHNWVYHEWNARRENTEYFNTTSPTGIAYFGNANVILTPSAPAIKKRSNECYLCGGSGTPQTIVLEVISPGYTSNGSYAYNFYGKERTNFRYGSYTYNTYCSWKYNDRIIGSFESFFSFTPSHSMVTSLPKTLIGPSGDTHTLLNFIPTNEVAGEGHNVFDCSEIIEISGYYRDTLSNIYTVRFNMTFEDIIYEDLRF